VCNNKESAENANNKYAGKWMELGNNFYYIDSITYYKNDDEARIWASVELWKTVNTSVGTFVSTVTSANSDAYPTNGKHTDGYWYIKQ